MPSEKGNDRAVMRPQYLVEGVIGSIGFYAASSAAIPYTPESRVPAYLIGLVAFILNVKAVQMVSG